MLRAGLIVCICFLSAASLAQSLTLKDIRLEGLQRISPGTVFNYLPIKIGDTIDSDATAAAVRALFKTGFFEDVRMELEGTGIRSTIVRPGPTGSEFGRDWDPKLIQRILASWKYWGVQRHFKMMPAESVAAAVVSVVSAPPGTHIDVVQVMPEGPPSDEV